jgi:hypothetical protein
LNRITTIVFAALPLAVALQAAPANAQNTRSFVSGLGSDAAACTFVAPCRSLAFALTKTNPGGEIDVLDAAGYGSLTIDRAISIVNDGVGTASVTVPSSGIGIQVAAGANDAVSLRGLSVEGGGLGLYGIHFSSGKSLTVENCVIRHVTQNGIGFSALATSALTVSNSLVSDNGSDGIQVRPNGAGAVTAVFNHVRANNNARHGIFIDGEGSSGTLKATVYDSVAAGNASGGFFANTNTGNAPTTLMVFHSVAANNGTGLFASGTGAAILRVTHSMVTGNTNGWLASGAGVVKSYGNNSIDGNVGGQTAPPGIPPK